MTAEVVEMLPIALRVLSFVFVNAVHHGRGRDGSFCALAGKNIIKISLVRNPIYICSKLNDSES
jgi:hypothetical protein